MIKWKVRRLAESRGMNIGQLAEKAEIAYSSALDLWHGRAQRISLVVMNRLCMALDCTPCDLFDYEVGDMVEEYTDGPETEAEALEPSLSAGPSVFVAPLRAG